MTNSPDVTAIVRDAATRCLRVLRERPAGLLTDIDGTISLIAPTPDAAVVDRAALVALRELARHINVVGAVSGRAALNAEEMLGSPELMYVGNHGFERRERGQTITDPNALKAISAVAAVLDAVQAQAVAAHLEDGLIFENKGVTGSVHYRLAKDQEASRFWLVSALTAAAVTHDLRVSEGRMVIELRPALAINKGTAVRSILDERGLRGLVFLGDDITDLDAFRALAERRAAGLLAGVNVAVVSAESPPEVAQMADVVVPGVDACVQLLSLLASGITGPKVTIDER